MSNISASLVKELREATGAGMMDCKKALTETNGNMEEAIDYLKKKGMAKAANKSDRIAAEGQIVIEINSDLSKVTMCEINSETDFVAKNENFTAFADETNKHIHTTEVSTREELSSTTINGVTFEEYLKEKISKIGENIVVRRFVKLSASEGGFVQSYLHSNGKVGVVLAVKAPKNDTNVTLVKDICMHIAAMKPKYLSTDEIPSDVIAKESEGLIKEIEKDNEERRRLGKPERTIPTYISKAQLTPDIMAKVEDELKAELKAEGKPEKIWDKILPGKIEKFIADNSQLDQRLALLSQEFVKSESRENVGTVLAKAGIDAIEFIRFELGDGIEKKACDFAAEVAEQMK